MPSDSEFLRDYLRDAREDMSWRRELEFRLLQYLLVFYPILGTAMITLYQTDMTRQTYAMLAAGTAIFIIAASLFVTERVYYEHKAYADIGRTVQKIWTYFELFEPGAYLKKDTILSERLRDPKKGFAQGHGYRKTLALIWTITVSMLAVIIALAFLKTP